MSKKRQPEENNKPLANTMKYAKRIHKNTQTRVKQVGKQQVRVKLKGYLSLREFIRKNADRFVNPQGKLKTIIEGAE